MAAVCCSTGLAEPAVEEIYERYLKCDLTYFLNCQPRSPLELGLKAIVAGDLTAAEQALLKALPGAPDSLRSAIFTDLAHINYARHEWRKGNEYALRAEPGSDPQDNPLFHFPTYPKESVQTPRNEVNVPFLDHFYVRGTVRRRRGSGHPGGYGMRPERCLRLLCQAARIEH